MATDKAATNSLHPSTSDPSPIERLEQALAASEHRYRIIVETASEGIWAIDEQGVTSFVNSAMADILGYARDEMVGRPMYDFMDERAQEDARSNMGRRRTGLAERHPFRLQHKTGHDVWTTMASNPVLDQHGRFTGAVALVTDETERMAAAEAQKLREQELVRLDKMVSLNALVAGVIHEINNPIHFITLNASLTKRVWQDAVKAIDAEVTDCAALSFAGLPYPELREEVPLMLEQISTGVDRIARIVSELRTFANTDPGGPMRPVKINDVVSSAITLLEGRIRRVTDHFTHQLAPELPMVWGDAAKLVQVVVNLVLNALESLTHRKQPVAIMTRHRADLGVVEVVIRDGGTGIENAELQKIRTPFFTTKHSHGGLGLGLPVAERILTEHRALLVLDSRPGVGTDACVRLPVNKPRETTP